MRTARPLDLVGIGFGPAGVALAAAIEDLGERQGVRLAERVAFFETRSSPGWQTSLLFRNADIQHHYLRDLATPRDPRSRFTFANFLKEQDRIFEFGSLVYGGGGGAVSRIEWSEYVAWAARLLDDYVTYESPVKSVRLTRHEDKEVIAVSVPEGEVLTRAIAFCGGGDLYYPPVFRDFIGDRVFHATGFLDKLKALRVTSDTRVSIVGAGQTAIEITQYLHNTYPGMKVNCIQRTLGFHHGNHSPFIGRMFHPKESDYFFSLSPQSRKRVLEEVARANYAAVDREAVGALYRTLYEDKLLGTERIRMRAGTEVVAVRKDDHGVFQLDTRNHHDGATETVAADVVVLATGFVEQVLPSVLQPLSSILCLNEIGEPDVNYDYSLKTTSKSHPLIYLSGAAEPSHGLGSSASFSMIALKAERVTAALVASDLLPGRRSPDVA
jgi:L-ornithine N5-oxygenase